MLTLARASDGALYQVLFARDGCHAKACRLRHAGVVGGLGIVGPLGMSSAQGLRTERLRGLHADDAVAINAGF